MKKALSLLVALLLALLPFSPIVHAATGTFSATVTIPNVSATTLVFPALSGGATSTAAVSATGSFTVDATSTTGSTTSILVGGTELLGSSVDFNTDATLTASDLAAAINAHTSTSGFTASASGVTVTVTAPTGTGTSTNGATFTITSSGDLAFTTTPFSGGVDAGAAASATSTSDHFTAVASSTDLTLSIGSTTITLTAGMTATQAASTTAADINADSSNPYTASVVNTDEVMLTAKASGTAGNGPVVASDLTYNGTAEVVTFTPSSVTVGETYRVTINGTNYDYVALSGNTAADVTAALAPMIDANAAVSCTSNSTMITCTSSTVGTPFTASATVLASSSGGTSVLNPVTISSSNANTACAKPGDVVTVNFTSSSALGTSTSVTIGGHSANVVSLGSNMYAASTTLNASTTEGTVTFLISPFDTSGNAGTTTASTTNASTVTFDMTTPGISLNGVSPLHVAFGSVFSTVDPGAAATDTNSVTVTNNANTSLNTQSSGTYTVTYTASDCAGNTATTTRTVIVDPGAPQQGGHHHDVSGLFGSSSVPGTAGTGAVTISDGSTIAYLLDPITIGPSGTFPLIPNTGVEVFVFNRDLSLGMSGDDVAELQARLFETGLLRVSPTGYFGSLTRDAVIRLQRGNGLTVTGTLNAQTRVMLNES